MKPNRGIGAILPALLLLVSLPATAAPPERMAVAVLDLEVNTRKVTLDEAQYIADAVRTAAARDLDRAAFHVMARDTMELLVPPSEIECLAAQCLAKIGQRLQAKYVVGGSLKDVGSQIGVTLQVYQSVGGELMGSQQGLADDAKGMVALVQQLAPKVLAPVAGTPAGGGQSSASPGGASGSGFTFSVSRLADVPQVQAPRAVEATAQGLDFGSVDVDGLETYDAAVRFDKGDAPAADKARRWADLAKAVPRFADTAKARAAEWQRFAGQQRTAEAARKARVAARDADWGKLRRLLALSVVPDGDKRRWVQAFVEAYGRTMADNPYTTPLAEWLPAGAVEEVVQWVTIPGGMFRMGAEAGQANERPVHSVTVPTFQMAKSEVTVRQYRLCVEAGACPAPNTGGGCNWGVSGRDDHPVNCVDWSQAVAFSAWAGGRLPTEAEWEYAARSGGKDVTHPWGNEPATCSRTVMDDGGSGCGRNGTWPVCSKPSGNSEQGLCDLSGNVWEWVQDWYHDSYSGAPSDGSAWESPAGSFRVVRGGSWGIDAGGVRAAGRYGVGPGRRYVYLGFRPSRSL